jgi:hypothetical protein
MPQRRRGYTGEHERAMAKKARRERERNSKENKQQAAQIKGLQSKLGRQSSTQAAPPPKPADDLVIKQRPAKNTDKRSEAKEKAQSYKGSSFKQKYGHQFNTQGAN